MSALRLLGRAVANRGKCTCDCDLRAGVPTTAPWRSDQPRTLEETTTGAKNRARGATAAEPSAELGIGLESGLFQADGRLFDVCACSLWDGETHHVGYSCAWELPPRVVEQAPPRSWELRAKGVRRV